ncbi:E3 ubiquitin-protein ligase RNF182 [Stigmatopora argus]
MNGSRAESDEKDPSTKEELECKICYQRYNAHQRRPKLLDCLHRVCGRCLQKILYAADGAGLICCPFCRHQTHVGESGVSALPDDANLMNRLTPSDKFWSSGYNREVILSPKSLFSGSPSRDSPNCLFITIVEVQREARFTSHDGNSDTERNAESLLAGSDGRADRDSLSKFCNHIPRILVWLLGFLYFGSLPLGIYLLVIQRVTLGIICVSLVPSSLTVCLVYGFCQCLCQGVCDCSSRG